MEEEGEEVPEVPADSADDDDVPPEVWQGEGEEDEEDVLEDEEPELDDEYEEDDDDDQLLPEDLAAEHERTLKRFFQVTGIDITQFRGQGEEE
jgi:hypothetical protein